MPSLKDLKTRISSVGSTRKITRAKQMVAAAKLRRAEERATRARPYAERLESVLARLAPDVADSPGAPALLAGTGRDQTRLFIVATADKGLCGGFNSSIVRLAREHIEQAKEQKKKVKIICVGRKADEQLRRLYGDDIVWKTGFADLKQAGFAQAHEISSRVLSMFAEGAFDVAMLFYGKFESVMSQPPVARQIIPVQPPQDQAAPLSAGTVYEYEPGEMEVLEAVLPRYVTTGIFKAILENIASEQAASMTAMDNATRNAGEMIGKLTLQYNRARQAQITGELIEIISGAEAL